MKKLMLFIASVAISGAVLAQQGGTAAPATAPAKMDAKPAAAAPAKADTTKKAAPASKKAVKKVPAAKKEEKPAEKK